MEWMRVLGWAGHLSKKQTPFRVRESCRILLIQAVSVFASPRTITTTVHFCSPMFFYIIKQQLPIF